MSKLGNAPQRGKGKGMLGAQSPKDKKLLNFEATSDQIKIWKNFCTDHNISMKELFTEGAKLYMEEKENGNV